MPNSVIRFILEARVMTIKKVSINYQSWLYPLEGEDAKYFIPLPNRECTYEKLGDAKELLEYLEKCIE